MNHNGHTPRRQYIWIVRYGLTEHALVEGVGPYDSDIDPTEGITHAEAIAKRIASADDPESLPKAVFADPFLRTTHTADILCRALPGPVPLRIEDGLTEWMVPSLLVDPEGNRTEPRSAAQLKELFPDTIDEKYESVNPVGPDVDAGDDDNDVPPGCPRFEETGGALLKRCATTMTRLLELVGGDSIAIVGHAPCNQAVALYLEGSEGPSESKLGPWDLGGVTLFSRPVGGEGEVFASNGSGRGPWTLEFYSDTSHMPGEYAEGLKAWSLPGFAR